MASPAYRADASSAYNSNNTTLTVTKPTGTVENDVLLFAVELFTDTNSLNALEAITWPAGFTELQTIYNNSVAGQEIQLTFAWKLAGGAEGASYATSWPNNRGNKGNIVAYSGGYTVTPIDDSAIAESSGESTSVVSPSVTAANTDTLYVVQAGQWNGSNWTPATDFNERITTSTALWLADKAIAAAGATGTFTHTISSDPWVAGGVLIASQADPVAGGTRSMRQLVGHGQGTRD